MPRIESFAACEIRINFNDHMPPHFHVLDKRGREWLVRIDNGVVLEGPRDLRAIRAELPAEVALWAGGAGARDLERTPRGVHVFDTLQATRMALAPYRKRSRAQPGS